MRPICEALRSARERVALEIDQSSALPNQPIAADAWVVSSTLQKAIRRSEVQIAQRAVLTLFKLRGSGIWRRLTVIAFEDVGIGSIDALTSVTTDPVKVTQIGSPIGREAYQRATLKGLGLNKLRRSRVLEDTPEVRGMIERVKHLVRIDAAS